MTDALTLLTFLPSDPLDTAHEPAAEVTQLVEAPVDQRTVTVTPLTAPVSLATLAVAVAVQEPFDVAAVPVNPASHIGVGAAVAQV